MTEYRNEFSPVVNTRLETEETGKLHKWIENIGAPYYGSTCVCKNCGRLSWGWNLWREDFLKTCRGKKED